MFLVFFCMALLSNVFASDLSVLSQVVTYKLHFDESVVRLDGTQIEFLLKKTECNADILRKFNRRMEILKNMGPLKVSQGPHTFQFILNGKTYFETYKSKTGVFLLTVPDEIQKMKLEEKYLCQK